MIVDAAAIRELAELASETGLTEIEIESGGQRFRISRQVAAAVSLPPGVTSATVVATPVRGEPSKAAAGTPVTSPMVGTVYVAPEPGKPPFVKIGDIVREGDTLLVVEAMKTMNPILAPKAATVREICIADAQPVEFGQTLVILS
ncbi:MAG TPA: biotin/lipoyl-containing protein [Rhizomicrobium sp.]